MADAELCGALGTLGLKNAELDPSKQRWKFRNCAVGSWVRDPFGREVVGAKSLEACKIEDGVVLQFHHTRTR